MHICSYSFCPNLKVNIANFSILGWGPYGCSSPKKHWLTSRNASLIHPPYFLQILNLSCEISASIPGLFTLLRIQVIEITAQVFRFSPASSPLSYPVVSSSAQRPVFCVSVLCTLNAHCNNNPITTFWSKAGCFLCRWMFVSQHRCGRGGTCRIPLLWLLMLHQSLLCRVSKERNRSSWSSANISIFFSESILCLQKLPTYVPVKFHVSLHK